jgi:DDB1- and CUL4-associated factor 12
LTIGTGTGAILFYDLRAAKYLRSNQNQGEIMFKTNGGWVVSPIISLILRSLLILIWIFWIRFAQPKQGMDETSQEFPRYAPAIYTHCYDESGTRLFAAGGPLAVERQGNYASLWS